MLIQRKCKTGAVVLLLVLAGAAPVLAQCGTMTEVGSWHYGNAGAVALAGARVYQGSGDHLIISELSAAPSLAELDLGGRVRSLKVSGATVAAYVDDGLVVVDAAAPQAPVIAASLPISDVLVGLEFVGSTLFTVQRDGLMHAVDLADPYHPRVASFVHLYSGAYRLAVQDGLAAVVYADEYVSVVDISDIDLMVDLGAQELAGSLVDVVLTGDEAVGVGGSGQVYRYDITAPAAWALLDSAVVDDGPAAVESFQGEILIQSPWSGLSRLAWDAGGASLEPVLARPGFQWMQLALDAQRIAIADWEQGVTVFDAADLLNPTPIRHDPSQALEGRLLAKDGYLFAGAVDGGLRVLDVHDPSAPVSAARLEADWVVRDMVMEGDMLYAIVLSSGLVIVDVSDPEAPVQIGHMAFGGNVYELAVADGLAYVMELDVGLRIIDVSDPAAPALLNTYGVTGSHLSAEGRTLAMINSGVLVFDMTDPSAPGLVGPIDMGGLERAIAMAGGYAYVNVELIGIGVLDVRDPMHPVVAGLTAVDGPKKSLHAVGGSHLTLYNDGTVRVYDLADPLAPAQVECKDIGPYSGDITAEGDHVYVWNTYDGVTVYRTAQTVATEDEGQAPSLLGGRALSASPNPFNPATVIAFELAAPGRVELTVHDALGRRVRTLAAGAHASGRHEVRWDGVDAQGRRAGSGVYFVRLATDAGVETRKVMLAK